MTVSVSPATVTPPRRRKPPWWSIVAVLVALGFVAANVVTFAANLDRRPGVHAAAVKPSTSLPAGVYPGEQSMTGDDLLTAIADRLGASAADIRTGTYELIHSVVWSTEIQGPIRAVDQQTWRLPNSTVRYAIQRSQTLPATGFDPVTASLDFATATARVQDNTVDPDLVDRPDIILSAVGDPVAQLDWYLAAQRHGQSASNSVRIAELVSLYHYQIVPATMRAAILRLLAGLPETTFTHQRTTDPLHRAGIAFHTGGHSSETTLIIDSVTGTLNAVEERVHGRLFAYTLFYPSQWTDHRGPQTPQPTPISTIRPTQTAWPAANQAPADRREPLARSGLRPGSGQR